MNGRASSDNTLLILPSLTEKRDADGRLILPRKFLDGICEYRRLWRGRVLVAMETSKTPDWVQDTLAVEPADLPFEFQSLPADNAQRHALIRSVGLVEAALVPRHVGTGALCAAEHTPLVYHADTSLALREGIVRAETRNPLRLWRRLVWTRRLETRYHAALRHARGIQCNGTATFEAYRAFTPHPLFYLDTHVRQEMLATQEERHARRIRLEAAQPLRLVYSGRLVAIKGVLDLPRVSAALRQRGVAFTLDIFGRGELRGDLEREISRLNLTECVRVHGELPFPELVRRVARESDLFVACHPQGDPSTTFLETMGCGVPLVGYDTVGLRGIITNAGAGWLTTHLPDVLAARIAELDRQRSGLIAAADISFEFARTRTFEKLTRLRIEHLEQCAADMTREGAG